MRQKTLILAAVFLCVMSGHTVYADAKADARRSIQAAYDRYAAAVLHSNVDTIMSIKASGYVNININGDVVQRSDEEARRHYKELTAAPNRIVSKFRILSLDIHGNEAIVTDVEHTDDVLLDTHTSSLIPVHEVESDRDFWGKGGRAVAMEAVPDDQHDGRVTMLSNTCAFRYTCCSRRRRAYTCVGCAGRALDNAEATVIAHVLATASHGLPGAAAVEIATVGLLATILDSEGKEER